MKWFLFLLSIIPLAVFSQAGKSKWSVIIDEDQERLEMVNLRNKMSGDRNYLGIAARDNTTSGHAFVILGKENSHLQMSEITVIGFYPEKAGKFFDEGRIVNDFCSLKYVRGQRRQLYFILDDDQYQKAISLVLKWKEKPPRFNLFTKNCIDFTQQVAAAVGVTLPSRGVLSLTPARYLDRVNAALYSTNGLAFEDSLRVTAYIDGTFAGKISKGKFSGPGRINYNDRIVRGNFTNNKLDSLFKTEFSFGTSEVKVLNYSSRTERIARHDGSVQEINSDSLGRAFIRTTWPNGDNCFQTFELIEGLTKSTFTGKGFSETKNYYRDPTGSKVRPAQITIRNTQFVFEGEIWQSPDLNDKNEYQKGTMTFSNGDTYSGNLRNWKLHGEGRLIHRGKRNCAIFGLFCESSSYDITDNFKDNWAPGLARVGIRPPPSTSLVDPNQYKVPLPPPATPDRTPNVNASQPVLSDPSIGYRLDPVPNSKPAPPPGYHNGNSYYDWMKGRWILL